MRNSGTQIVKRHGPYSSKLTIEPVIFLSFMALSSIYVSEHIIVYQTVCHRLLNHSTESYGCNLTGQDDVRDRVQFKSSFWTAILSVSYSIPAIIGENMLGAWGDQYGRKGCLLVALASLVLTTVPDALLTYYIQAPLISLVGSTAVSGIAGSGSTLMSISLAYVADHGDQETLTHRMTILLVCKALGGVSGAFLLGSIRPYLSFGANILVAQFVLAAAFFYVLIVIPSKSEYSQSGDRPRWTGLKRSPEKTRRSPEKSPEKKPGEKSCSQKMLHMVWYAVELNRATFWTLLRRRRGRRRRYLVIITIIYFLYIMSDFSLLNGPVFSFYVFDHPFYWSSSDLSKFRGVQNVSFLIGNVLGFIVIRRLPTLSNASLIPISLGSGFVYLIIVAIAKDDWALYAAATLGTLSNLMVPSTKAFVSQQVRKDEVGRALAMNGMAAEMGFVITRITFTYVYGATAGSPYAGPAFLLGAAVVGLCLIPALWVHWKWRSQRRRIGQLMTIAIVTPPAIVAATDGNQKCFL